MTGKAILSAIIFTVIYLVLLFVIIKLLEIGYKEDYWDKPTGEFLVFVYLLLLVVFTVIMLMYTNCWITIIASIIIIILLRGIAHKYMVTDGSLYIFLILSISSVIIYLLINEINVAHLVGQYIETESTNIVYGEDIKVEDLPQDTIYIEKIVLEEHYNLIRPFGSEEYYEHLEDEDSYQYYYKIEEKNGITKSMSKIILGNNVKIQYIKDKEKAMMKKIVTEKYYEKTFFGIEVPMLKKGVETKYEFCIPKELLEIVEIK